MENHKKVRNISLRLWTPAVSGLRIMMQIPAGTDEGRGRNCCEEKREKTKRNGSREVRMNKKLRKQKVVTRKLKKFLIGGDATPLRNDDFRSARLTIPLRAFAYVKKLRVELDPVDLKTWTELQAAPDDVCLQTTEYHGSALKIHQELQSAWIEKIGFAEDDSLRDDALWKVAYEAEAEWQASTFASAHGFYRQAIETLRVALERTIIGLRYPDEPSHPHFTRAGSKAKKLWGFSQPVIRLSAGTIRSVL